MKKIFIALSAAALAAVPAFAFANDGVARAGLFGGGSSSMFVMLGLALVFFYFIILRPERKRRKDMEARRNAMKKGDRITTSTGIRGTLYRVEADSVILKLYDGAKMEVLKAAIMDIQPGHESGAEDKTAQIVDARS